MTLSPQTKTRRCRCCRHRCRCSKSGFTTVTVLFLVTLALISVIVMTATSLTQIRLSVRAQEKAIGLSVAEAGVDDTIAHLAADPDSYGPTGTQSGGNGQTAVTFSPVTLYENQTAGTGAIGRYRVTLQCIDDGKRPIPLTRRVISEPLQPGSNTTLGINRVVADVQILKSPLGNGALMASDDIDISGGAIINTQVSQVTDSDHIADVVANGDVTMGGSSYVDGKLAAAGAVTGTAYYPSVSGTYATPYPETSTTEQWRQTYLTASRATNNIYNNAVKTTATITAPAYIKNGIQLSSSDTVILAPNPSLTPDKNVIYVDGDIKMSGQCTLKNGVLLVVAGTFDQAGGTTYRVFTKSELPQTTPEWPTPTLMVYNILSGSPIDNTSISLTGGGENIQEGIVYAVNGDIKLAGGTVFNGALVAGGTNGSISVNGNYSQYYPTGLHSLVEFYTGARVANITEQQTAL